MDEETLAAYYERLPVGDDYFANVQAYAQAERDRDLAKIGQPVDRSEWGMTASTVNAYYSPSMCVLCLNLAAAVRSIARALVTAPRDTILGQLPSPPAGRFGSSVTFILSL